MDNLKHIPVMLNECIEGLNLKDGGVYFDGTLGGAGHSYQILSRADTTLYATDLDVETIERAKVRLQPYEGRFTIVNDNFKNFQNVMDDYGIKGFDGILLDFGVSSFQLDDKSRGFSYLANDEELDMRMNKSQSFSAKTLVNTYSVEELKRILSDYGNTNVVLSATGGVSP